MSRVIKYFILPLGFLVIVGCSNIVEPPVAPPPDIPIAQLNATPETTTVQGRQFYLYTSMWRDFMPISPPDGRPLAGTVFITALDSLRFSDSLSTDAVWIVENQQVWKSWFSIQQYPPNEIKKNQLARIFNNGPKWGPDIYVTVVIRLTDRDNQTHLLRASHQYIGMTQ
jgi:hypothetical protein